METDSIIEQRLKECPFEFHVTSKDNYRISENLLRKIDTHFEKNIKYSFLSKLLTSYLIRKEISCYERDGKPYTEEIIDKLIYMKEIYNDHH